jgi:hypothetical protein
MAVMDELREMVARAMYTANGGGDPDEIWMGEPSWRLYADEADAAIATVSAEVRALRARVAELEGAFLETREMLGLVEQVVCEECCPTVWVTEMGQPHSQLHKDIQAVLFKHEAVRDACSGALAIKMDAKGHSAQRNRPATLKGPTHDR